MFLSHVRCLCLICLGCDAAGSAVVMGVEPVMWQPAKKKALLYLIYDLLAGAVAATAIAAIAQFSMELKDNPVKALKSLIGIFALAAVLFVSWILGSDQPLNIQGYEGADNVPFWLKITDMLIYTIYFFCFINKIIFYISHIIDFNRKVLFAIDKISPLHKFLEKLISESLLVGLYTSCPFNKVVVIKVLSYSLNSLPSLK